MQAIQDKRAQKGYLDDATRIMRTTDELISSWEHHKATLRREQARIQKEIDRLDERIEEQRKYAHAHVMDRLGHVENELE